MSTLPIQIAVGALPPNARWTPQQLIDAAFARAYLVTAQSFALFVSGSTEPSSNVGPWLKDGNTWYVWSDTAGGYVPQILEAESLGYWIGVDAPDPTIFSFWISTTAGGAPIGLNIFYNGAWTDVYSTSLTGYLTVAAFNAAIANYSTTAQMNSAISSAIAAAAFLSYPAQANNSGVIVVPMDGIALQLALNTAPINPAPAPYSTTTYRYTAPADGNYCVSFISQFDSMSGVDADTEVVVGLYKNGAATNIGDTDGTPSPNGGRWSPGFSGMIRLNATEYIDVRATAGDGVGINNITLTTAVLSVWRVSA